MNVGSHLSKRAELNPGLEALVDDVTGRRFTFSELDERAHRIAHLLLGLGLAKGDRVAVLLPNGHPFVETFYGAARAGLVVVVLNCRLVAHELAFMLRDSGATVLVFDAEYDALVDDLHGRGGGIDADGTLRSSKARGRIRRWSTPTVTTRCSSCTRRAPPGCPKGCCTPTTAGSGPYSPIWPASTSGSVTDT